ncbi:MAG: hypothetical protein C5B54_11065 [Acidobacteria bacterium]|nr:MAG: hypothetical protein C5B54_11065 [Acidobacteriota bacterium]
MKFFCSLLLILFVVASVAADLNEKIEVQATHLYFSALDEKHKFVSDLHADDLVLAENGKPQKILGVSNLQTELGPTAESREPITVTFCMDTSASMAGDTDDDTGKMPIIKKAAMELLQFLQKDDQMSVVPFNSLPHTIPQPTSDKATIIAQLSGLHSVAAETALLDSVYMIVDEMEKYNGRKFLVLGTDGLDTISHVKLDELLERLNTSDVTVLVFGFPSTELSSEADTAHYSLKKMAEVTGGYAFFVSDPSALPQIMNQIGRALRSQYIVWYRPNDKSKEDSWRNVQLMCRRPGVDLHYRNKVFSRRDSTVSQPSTSE